MKKILILLLALMPIITAEQNISKEEKKALKAAAKAERQEQRRIQDSIWRAEETERERTLAEAKQRIKEKEQEIKRRNKSVSLLVVTPFEDAKSVFDALIYRMMQEGITPALIDKDYYIIRTPRRQVSVGTYDITFSVMKIDGKVCVRGSGMGYGSFSVGSGMFRSDTDMIVPLEYGSEEGSTAKTAWNDIEHYLLGITHIEAIYE